MKESPLIHPTLFAVFPILFVFSHNVQETPLTAVIKPLALAVLLALLLLVIFRLITGSWQKSGIMASLTLLLFFSYGHVVTAAGKLRIDIGIAAIEASGITFLSFCFLWCLGIFLLYRTRFQLSKLTTPLNLIVSVLVFIQVVQSGYTLATWPSTDQAGQAIDEVLQMPDNPPDIYFIVMDGYGRHDLLQDIYGYDNSSFLDHLRGIGFSIADKGHSNYCQTLLSLCATLNLDYVSQVGSFDPESSDRVLLTELVHKNYLFRILKKCDYHLVALASGYEATELRNVDTYLSPGLILNEFENIVLNTTPVPFLLRKLPFQYDMHRKRINQMLEQLVNLDKTNSPFLVFAHFLVPHPPFVFGANGEPVEPDRPLVLSDGSHFREGGGTVDEYLNGYKDQTAYVTERLRETIDGILSRYQDNLPIIIIQGDHGPGAYLHWNNVEKSDVKERLSILNACYLPGVDSCLIYEDITPVNTFRVILNEYFGANFELLPDKSYYSCWDTPYNFIDVTEELTCPDEK